MPDALIILDDEDFDEAESSGLDGIDAFGTTHWLPEREAIALMERQEAGEDDDDPVFEFGAGPPELGVLYVTHPLVWGLWLPAADYHRLVFEDKVAEALQMVAALGATHVEAEHIAGWGQEIVAELSVPIAGGIDGRGTASGSSRSLFHAQLDPGDPPESFEALVEENELVWPQFERLWHPMIHARLARRLKTCSLAVTFEQDWGIDASLEGVVRKLGVRLGGTFTRHVKTDWRLQVEFD